MCTQILLLVVCKIYAQRSILKVRCNGINIIVLVKICITSYIPTQLLQYVYVLKKNKLNCIFCNSLYSDCIKSYSSESEGHIHTPCLRAFEGDMEACIHTIKMATLTVTLVFYKATSCQQMEYMYNNLYLMSTSYS